MLRVFNSRIITYVAAFVFCCGFGSSVYPQVQTFQDMELRFHATVPLGVEGFILKPANRKFYLFAAAQNQAFEGMYQSHQDGHRVLLDSAGQRVHFYPEAISFRVTATGWDDTLLNIGQVPIKAKISLEDLLVNLRFRLVLFRGLKTRSIYPAGVKMIGMPADVPYDERIYGVTFRLDQVPISDRAVLEILAPNGERLQKFHLDLE